MWLRAQPHLSIDTLTTGAVSVLKIAALAHKVRNDAMKRGTLVVQHVSL